MRFPTAVKSTYASDCKLPARGGRPQLRAEAERDGIAVRLPARLVFKSNPQGNRGICRLLTQLHKAQMRGAISRAALNNSPLVGQADDS